jgi:hypothetical protein
VFVDVTLPSYNLDTTQQEHGVHVECFEADSQLSYHAVGIEDFLQIGTELAIYTIPDDLLVQVGRLLAGLTRRRGIAEAAWRRCRAEHTYAGRVADWLSVVWPDEASVRSAA